MDGMEHGRTCCICAVHVHVQVSAAYNSSTYASGGLQAVIIVQRTKIAPPAVSVGFRGTMEKANWAVDKDTSQVPPAHYLAHSNITKGMLIHRGFQKAYSALRWVKPNAQQSTTPTCTQCGWSRPDGRAGVAAPW